MWTPNEIPDLSGKVFIVTGGNSGIGYEAAREFVGHGAHVVLACRDEGKAGQAAQQMAAGGARGSAEVIRLDLASLASVREFADRFGAKHSRLDALVNNAGVMALPYRKTADGFEMQIGTNHLGHYALTGALLGVLLATEGSRVVTVSSGMHKGGRIRFDDLNFESGYSKWPAYCQSKLANLLFTYELQRRLEGAGKKTIAAACHPGYAATNLQAAGPRMEQSSFGETIMEIGNRLLAQSAAAGAMPTMYAATAPGVRGGDYIGPNGFQELWGAPVKVTSNAASHDRDSAKRLWELSEKLTGTKYELS